MTTPTAPEPTHRGARAAHAASGPSYPFETDDSPAATTQPDNGASARGGTGTPPAWVTVWRWISFVAGCALLVWCAWALGDRIPRWSAEHGRVLVFLVFFLIMSIAGRWFWKGIDAALNRIIGGHE